MWSGHLSNYGMLRIFGCVAYSHVKQGKLESKAVKCILLGYPEGVKGYRLYRLDDESPKIVEVELQELNNHTLEEDQTDQEDGDDDDARDQETDQTPDLTDYQLFEVESCYKRRDGFSKEEQDLGVSRSSSWAKADDMLIACKSKAKIRSTKSVGFVDSDYAKDPDKGRSITGYAFLVQGCVAFLLMEAIWLRDFLEELGVELNTVAVNYDNQEAIHLSRNHVFHERTKHINVRHHFIREVLEAKTVKVLKVGTEHNAADALTKVVPGLKLQHFLELLNVGVG
ncbi:retrovirus-related pol polyprotein from transposon TNT 1-94 [Tanacetum coccineum]